jgi:hypothetical protein
MTHSKEYAVDRQSGRYLAVNEHFKLEIKMLENKYMIMVLQNAARNLLL